MSASNTLPPLPLAEWEDTKTALHLFFQMAGKVRLALMPPQNHWWHVTLYVDARGVTTRLIPWRAGGFEIRFDLVDHHAELLTTAGARRRIELPGVSVAELYGTLFDALAAEGITARITPHPYDLPFDTPFPADREHVYADPAAVHRFWQILVWASGVFSRFAGRFTGKTTPVHLFWHSFDLALTRFSGRAAPLAEGNAVGREAYTHEVISFGFWAGDANVRDPAFYSYAYPEPDGLRRQRLEPGGALWVERGHGSLALFPYEAARMSADPDAALLAFLESAYRAGATLSHWDVEALRHPAYGTEKSEPVK